MNSQPLKVKGTTRPIPSAKVSLRKKPLKVRHLLLISRIMIAVLGIGLIGYTLDRARRSFLKSSSTV